MGRMKASEALLYAFSREMLKIYGILILSDISLISGYSLTTKWASRGGMSGSIGSIIGAALLIMALILGIGGLVAFIYKILNDAIDS